MSFRVNLKPENIETSDVIEVRGGRCVGTRYHARFSADLIGILEACDIKTSDYISVFWAYKFESVRRRFDFGLRPPLSGWYASAWTPKPTGLQVEPSSADGYYRRVMSSTEPDWQAKRLDKVWITLYSRTKAAKVRMFV
jgi:hypothetical protein